ncbi:MAG: putative transposase [Parcubacteria group bacterium Gr01-1014_29]|nr:MAG: putative transposase [Parcubacteria group bacterium Gr01-1014_29]
MQDKDKQKTNSARGRPRTAPGEIYHIYNRGVEKRTVFENKADYYRFIRCLYELNNSNPVEKTYISKISPDVPLPVIRKEREVVVDILAFCLMPNHYHLMLQERMDGGITKFMRKIGTGYTNYFNQKNKRVGPLFQGTFKICHITDDTHFRYLPYYIHLNPLDLVHPDWREGSVKEVTQALQFLEQYRWSSLLDYLGIKNFPSITRRAFLEDILESPTDQKTHMIEWIRRYGVELIEQITLE